MYKKTAPDSQQTFFFSLADNLSRKHPLFILASKIDWHLLEKEFSKHYHPTQGRPAKPVRLMAGLLILKHLRDISDESVVGQWSENIYYQHFCGNTHFDPAPPCEASEWRHGERPVERGGVQLQADDEQVETHVVLFRVFFVPACFKRPRP